MKKRIIKITLLLLIVIFLLFPLTVLLTNVINIEKITPNFSKKLIEALKNSLYISTIVTTITIIISYIVSYIIIKYHYKRRNTILIFLTLPMLVPTFTHALGFISFWGKNGILNKLLNTNINIYGIQGIIICTICYVMPISLIMFVDLLASENRTPYKVANTLGIPKLSQFIKIKIPYILKPSLFIMFTIFTMSITDYGIPMMIGGKTITLTTLIYEQIIGRLNFSNGALLSIILLIPAIIMFIIGIFIKSHNNFEYRLEEKETKNKIKITIANLVYIILFIFLSFPLISCIYISFVKKFPLNLSFSLTHVNQVIQEGNLKYLLNSLTISIFASIIGIIISFIISYIVTRNSNKKTSKLYHILAIFTSSIPGIVLAVSYMLAFNKSIIYGTIIILIIINITRYIGNPYLILFNKLDNLDKTIEMTATTLGIPQKNIIIEIIIPQILPSIIEGFSYIFVNTMASVTTMIFLANTFTKPLAMVIVELEAHNFIEEASFISLIILITNIIIKTLANKFNKRLIIN